MKFTARLLALAAALFAASAFAQDKVMISITTGPTGGVYYPLGGGIANILSKYVPGYAANAESTAGSVANLQLMTQGKTNLALSMADAAWDGYKAQGKFSGGAVPVRTLMVAYPNRMHVVTVEGRGINSFADLKGKRVSTGAPNSATELMTQRLLEAYGMDWSKDIRRERLTPEKSAEAIKDNKLDAFFFVVGIPTSSVTDLAATPNTKIKLIDHADAVEKMVAKHGPLYVRDFIPAKSLPGPGQGQPRRHGVEPTGRAQGHARPGGLHHPEDDLRQARRADPGTQGSGEFRHQVPVESCRVDPLPSGGDQVFRREGRQAQLRRSRQADAPPARGVVISGEGPWPQRSSRW
jgi:TRAP transporter TAXI family solute receptor